MSAPLLKNEFVGLGPYRLTRWEVGSFMEFERFAAYYLGPPPLDRQMLAEAMAAGLAPVADSWIAPNHQLRRELEPSIPQFPPDPPRAQQLLATVGWTSSCVTRDSEAAPKIRPVLACPVLPAAWPASRFTSLGTLRYQTAPKRVFRLPR